MGHFGDVLPGHSRSLLLRQQNQTQQLTFTSKPEDIKTKNKHNKKASIR